MDYLINCLLCRCCFGGRVSPLDPNQDNSKKLTTPSPPYTRTQASIYDKPQMQPAKRPIIDTVYDNYPMRTSKREYQCAYA